MRNGLSGVPSSRARFFTPFQLSRYVRNFLDRTAVFNGIPQVEEVHLRPVLAHIPVLFSVSLIFAHDIGTLSFTCATCVCAVY